MKDSAPNHTVKMNHWALIGSSLLCFLLAFVWYGPLFGEAWARGAEVLDPQVPPTWATITAYVVGLFSCYGMGIILQWTGRSGVRAGLLLGLLVSVAFLLQVVIGPWLFAGRGLLFAVNMPYFTLCALISGAIIGGTMKTA